MAWNDLPAVASLGGFGAIASGVLTVVFGAKPAPKPVPLRLGGAMAPMPIVVSETSCDASLSRPSAP